MGILNRLTDRQCRNAGRGKHADGGGLHLWVRDDGRRFWRMRFFVDGVEKLRGYRDESGNVGGEYPDISLEQARKWRDVIMDEVRAGRDPLVVEREKKAATEREDERTANTLRVYAEQYHKSASAEFRNAKHRAQWLSSLTPILDKLGDKPLDAVTQEDLIDALAPMFASAPETAKRARQRIRSVFDAALFDKLIVDSPAKALGTRQAKRAVGEVRRKKEPHLRAMTWEQVPAFWTVLDQSSVPSVAVKRCLQFVVLTGARSGEARGATWSEISGDGTAWIVPETRTKQGEAHVVHLSAPARAILAELREARFDGKPDKGALIFPSPLTLGVISDMSLTMLLRRLSTGETRADGEPVMWSDLSTVHGFRSALSSFGYKRGYAEDVVEAALGHRETDRVKRAYQREQFQQERRELLDAWAAFVVGAASADVVAIDKRKRAK